MGQRDTLITLPGTSQCGIDHQGRIVELGEVYILPPNGFDATSQRRCNAQQDERAVCPVAAHRTRVTLCVRSITSPSRSVACSTTTYTPLAQGLPFAVPSHPIPGCALVNTRIPHRS
jgi:hypothetical protein